MKIPASLFTLLFCFIRLQAQTLLIPVKDAHTGLYGYKSATSKLWVIKPTFESAEWLVNDRAIVKKEKYGVINGKGKFILPPVYDVLSGDSLFIFSKNDTLGIADKNGKILLSGTFDHLMTDEESGTAIIIQDSLYGYWDTSGAYIKPFSQYELMFSKGIAYFETDDSKGFINKEGVKIVETEEGSIIELEGRGFIIQENRDNYFDSLGKNQFSYEKIFQVTDSLLLFRENGQYGITNRLSGANKGTFDFLSPFSKKRLAVARRNRKYGIVNESGTEVIPFHYDYIENFTLIKPFLKSYLRGKEYVVMQQGSLWGVINDIGRVVVEPKYESAKTEEEILWYTKNDSLKFFNLHSWKKVEPQEVLHFNLNRAIACMNDSACGLIDRKGKFFIPPTAHQLKDLHNGYYIVSDSTGTGVMDSTGKTVIPKNLAEVKILGDIQPRSSREDFVSDNFLYLFGKSGDVAVADVQGKIVSDISWKNLSVFDEDCKCFFGKNKKGTWDILFESGKKYSIGLDTPSVFSNGYAVVKKKGKYGLLNSRGKMKIPAKYETIVHQSNGLNFYQKNALWRLLSKEGKKLTDAVFVHVTEFKEGFSLVKRRLDFHCNGCNDTWGFLDKEGNFIPGFKKLYEITASRQASDQVKAVPFSITYLKHWDEISFELLADSSSGSSLKKEANKLILDELSSILTNMSAVSTPLLLKDSAITQHTSYEGMGIEIKSVTKETVSLEFYRESLVNSEDAIEDTVKVFWLKDNLLNRVFLTDLFADNSWISYLNEVIASKLRQQQFRVIPSHGSLVFFDQHNFSIGPDGLTFVLNETALGLSSDFSDHEVLIEYEELEEIIRKDGPLREFYK